MRISCIWRPAIVNSENGKAVTIPVLNPYDIYGRVFTLSWLSFFVAFLSWFAFPPLMSDIKKDLHLTSTQVSNSNIVGLCSTLIARFFLGPMCDRFGPRIVMASVLLVGAVPTAFVPLVNNASGLYAIRFFIGFLGGTFVPCQFWTAVFFDKQIVGVASSLTGGWGNAGGGVAFFVMPAIMHGLQHRGYSLSHSWKFAFDVCPLIIIVFVAVCVLLLGRDCPEGKWKDRTRLVEFIDAQEHDLQNPAQPKHDVNTPNHEINDLEKGGDSPNLFSATSSREEHPSIDLWQNENSNPTNIEPAQTHRSIMIPMRTAMSRVSQMGTHELEPITDPHSSIENPTFLDTFRVSFSLPTLLNALTYAGSFGGELAVESIVSSLYASHSKQQGQTWSTTLSGDWGSMLGLLNVVFRPVGGFISDLLYAHFKTPLAKKYWMLLCGFLMGVFLLYIGLYKGISMPGLIVSMAFMSLFMEMANGANYSLVPHTNPHHTGIVAGTTGAFGNLGGVMFSLAFRFTTFSNGDTDYMSALWYLGVTIMGINALCVFCPLAKENSY